MSVSIESYERFIKSHTHLLLILGAVFLVWRVGWHAIDRSADKAIAEASAKVEAAKAQATANQQLAVAAQQQAEKYRELVTTLSAQNAAIAQAVSQRNVQTAQAQQRIQIEPLPDVGRRWAQILALLPDDIRPSNGAVLVSEPAARTTVIALEAGQACSANLSDTEQRCRNDEQRIASCDSTVATCQAEVSGLQAQIVSDKQASDAEVKAVKATARRNVLKWAWRSAAGGSVLTLVGLTALGVL